MRAWSSPAPSVAAAEAVQARKTKKAKTTAAETAASKATVTGAKTKGMKAVEHAPPTANMHIVETAAQAPCAAPVTVASVDLDVRRGATMEPALIAQLRAAMQAAHVSDIGCNTHDELTQRILDVHAFRDTGGWEVHSTVDGRRYYHHKQHAVTQWSPPAGWCRPCPSLLASDTAGGAGGVQAGESSDESQRNPGLAGEAELASSGELGDAGSADAGGSDRPIGAGGTGTLEGACSTVLQLARPRGVRQASLCVWVCVCVCMRACVRVRVRVYLCVCVYVCVCQACPSCYFCLYVPLV